jgi:hypothetical protein
MTISLIRELMFETMKNIILCTSNIALFLLLGPKVALNRKLIKMQAERKRTIIPLSEPWREILLPFCFQEGQECNPQVFRQRP